MIIKLLGLAVLFVTLCDAASVWYASMQNEPYESRSSAYLVKLDLVAGKAEKLQNPGTSSDYPSYSLVYDDRNQFLYFISQNYTFDLAEGASTLFLKRVNPNVPTQEAETLLRLDTRVIKQDFFNEVQSPFLQSLQIDASKGVLFFLYGFGFNSILAALDVATKEIKVLKNNTALGFMGSLYDVQIDPDRSVLYLFSAAGIETADYSQSISDVNFVSISSQTLFGLKLDFKNSRFVWADQLGVFYKSISNANTSYYLERPESISVMYNFSANGKSPEQFDLNTMLDLDEDRIMIVRQKNVSSLPLLQSEGSADFKLLLDMTAQTGFLNFSRIYTMAPADGASVASPLDVSIAITAILVVTVAAAAASTAAGGSTATMTGPVSSAPPTPMMQNFGELVSQPSSIIWLIISQLQIMVILSQLGGSMPRILLNFSSGVSWIMLNFKGASFGIQPISNPSGMSRYARSIAMDVSQLFGSIMIIILIIQGSLLLIYASARIVLKKLIARESSNTNAAKPEAKEDGTQEKDKKESDKISKNEKYERYVKIIDEKFPKLIGQFFLFVYLTICTQSVTQLTVPDPAGGVFGGLVLILVCTMFWIFLFVALFRDSIQTLLEKFPVTLQKFKAIAPNFYGVFTKFLEEPLCDKYKLEGYGAGFVSIFVKYWIGVFTGGVQTIPVLQIVLIIVFMCFEFGYIVFKAPHKVRVLGHVEALCCFLRIVSLTIKLGITAANDNNEAAGLAIIIINAIALFVLMFGLLLGIIMKNERFKNLMDGIKKKSSQPKDEQNTATTMKQVEPAVVQKTSDVAA
ncbi:hypothetical protein MP638_000500 [Amoeboaphelidium occidentale]|nr:hypothetical protein MP638_000500 [Amoeboaphelidium occidentale]